MKKNNHHCFEFGLAHPCFLLSPWTGTFQCMDSRLVSVSYWKNRHSSQVITFSKTFGSFSIFSRISTQMLNRVSFCSRMSSFGTIFAKTFFICKFSYKIFRTVSLSMFTDSVIARILRHRFFRTISRIFSTLPSVFDVRGRSGQGSSLITSLLKFFKLLEHLRTR